MAEAADRAEWARTCAVLAQIFNANRSEDTEPIDPMKFFPWDPGDTSLPDPTPHQERILERLFPKRG